MEYYDQIVSQPDNWLTELFTKDEKDRQFAKGIHLPVGKSWGEWTAAQYNEWQEIYNPKPKQVTESIQTSE